MATPDEQAQKRTLPTTDQPLNGPRKGPWKPLLVTVAVFAVLIGLYLLGVAFLVPAD
ncbi:hypothetical protein [Nocardioides campestrisoli]|uniref:hypothetical protein n=1 Tax=Nocardioides campestrisoli TaxID=2736757 RepID=UPI0015E7A53F|nr:hypothetical protein [Nocardioides campestrisoli]